MTDDEILTLGSFCETLMGSGCLGGPVGEFEKQVFQHFMMTKPNELKAREGVYAVQDFFAHMQALVEQTDKLLQPDPCSLLSVLSV
jgi:hypothetical protein